MTPKEIIALTPTDAVALHARGVGGDDGAVSDYVKWGAWRRINTTEGLSPAEKLKAFIAFIENTECVVSRG